MSDVVIRCPHCGTTQQALGECEACHEADARYFCPNHAPGRWLDGPACTACGARFTGRTAGIPPAPSAAAPSASPPRERARPVEPIPPRPTPRRTRRDPMPPVPTREPEVIGGEWIEVDDRAPWPPARRPRAPGWPAELPIPTVRIGVGSVFGCLGRLVSAAVVLLVLAALAFFGYCGTPMGFDAEPAIVPPAAVGAAGAARGPADVATPVRGSASGV